MGEICEQAPSGHTSTQVQATTIHPQRPLESGMVRSTRVKALEREPGLVSAARSGLQHHFKMPIETSRNRIAQNKD